MKSQSLIQLEPDVAPLLQGADYIDIKTVEGELTILATESVRTRFYTI